MPRSVWNGPFVELSLLKKAEAAQEAAIRSLNPVIFPAVLFLLEFAFTRQGQHPVFEGYFDVLFLHFRQLGRDRVAPVIFNDVHGW